MQGQIERLLPVLAQWGAWIFGGLLLLSLLGIARLGRGRRFLVPAHASARVGSILLLLVALLSGLALYGVAGPMAPLLAQVHAVMGVVGRPAGEVAFHEVATDSTRRLSELRGRVVVLNLWATWCNPCRAELPEIARLQRDYASRGLVVLTVSTEDRARLQRFAAKYSYGTLNGYLPRIDWLDVPGRPLSLVIDRDGVVRDCFIGARHYAEFERSVSRCLSAST
ncbi:MAG TPA: TlpA disulfide reductase family protein [Candidatus Sulfotelmatobacter sp.]|nr:TlpA disulfide reductase family protein [Candidatus Sulfotelmatobacter sp.]